MFGNIKRPVAGSLGCVGGLILLTLLAYKAGPFERLDATALSRLAAHKESSVGVVAALFAHLADPLPQLAMLALVCLMALHWGRPRHAIAAVALVAGANLTTQVLKVVLAHPRHQPILGYRQIGPTGFPSGHATAAMAMALAFVLVVPRSWRPTTILIGACLVVSVSASVVVLHHHYPSDVVGGWLVAGGWCFAVVAVLRVVCQGGEEPQGRSSARLMHD